MLRSKNLVARAQTFSHYKSHNTIKFLIDIAPSGAFTYMLRYLGRVGGGSELSAVRP